jgi:hypothetical protein
MVRQAPFARAPPASDASEPRVVMRHGGGGAKLTKPRPQRRGQSAPYLPRAAPAFPFLDPTLPVAARVANLISLLTLEEKASLLNFRAPAIARLNAVIREALAEPGVQQRLAAAGADAVVSTPAELAGIMRSETEKWGRVVREARVTVN